MTLDPSVAADPVGMLAEEFVARFRDGEHPPLSEYTDKYPEHAERIRQLFPMLVVMEQAGSGVSAEATCDHALADTDETLKPDVIGGYRVIREVGRGGMGVVYEAEQLALGRRVALKVLPMQAVAGGSGLERFRREAKAAARLHHTNIVPVYEVGQDGGFYFYAMQFIQGQPLDEVLKELQRTRTPGFAATRVFEGSAPASALLADSGHGETNSSSSLLADQQHAAYYRSVARVGIQVAEAMQYAHREGVVHRDIKPSNLLLDADARVWVTDFGLAQTGGDALTQTGDIVGTVRYMAPERFRGWADPRSDVYSLGLTLYELIALQPAFHHPDRLTLIHRVTHDEPPRLRKFDPAVPRDLETIIAKATNKEPERRYATAEELAADLRRFVDDRPIVARRSSGAERVWRWCRRNPVVAGLIAAVVLAIAAGFAGTYRQMQVAEANERTAKHNEGEATRQRDSAQDANAQLRATQEALRRTLYASQLNLVQSAWEGDNVDRVVQLLDQQRPKPGEEDLRGFEWYYWRRLCHADLRTLTLARWPVQHAYTTGEMSSDGSRMVAVAPGRAGNDWQLKMWETAGGAEILTVPLPSSAAVYYSAIVSPDGTRIATLNGQNGPPTSTKSPRHFELKIWDAASRQALCTIPLPANSPARYLSALSHDGARIATALGTFSRPTSPAMPAGEVKVWDTATGQELFALTAAGSVIFPAFSPDGSLLAAAADRTAPDANRAPQSEVQVWDTATRQEVIRIPGPAGKSILSVTFSPDGTRMVATCTALGESADLVVYEVRTGTALLTIPAAGGISNGGGIAFSPDGKLLAATGFDTPVVVRVWDAGTGKLRRTLKGHTSAITALAFSRDGRQVLSAARDGTLKVWDATTSDESREQLVSPLPPHRLSSVLSPDGTRLARVEGGTTGQITVQVVDSTGGTVCSFPLSPGHAHGMAFSPDGRRLAITWHLDVDTYEVKVWDTVAGKELFTIAGGDATWFGDLAFHADGTRLVATISIPEQPAEAGRMVSGGIREWDAATGRELRRFQKRSPAVWNRVAYSPDGKRVAASCSLNGIDRGLATEATAVQVWDSATGQELRTLSGHGKHLDVMAFSPDGKRIAASSGEVDAPGAVEVWNATTGQHQGIWKGHSGRILSLAFSPDGRRVVTTAARGFAQAADEVKVWDASTGQELLSLKERTRQGDIEKVAFSPDGRRLLGVRLSATRPEDALQIWDATPLPEKP